MSFRALPLVVAGSLLATAGCTLGAPPGFSGGDAWSFPLVGPLEGGTLLVPVMIGDKGPYLFAVDPDSPRSVVDAAIVSEAGLHGMQGPEYVDESDHSRPMRLAEVPRVSIGDLTVKSSVFWVSDVGAFNTAGRQIRGVIGHDILADSLVFGFDRQAGRMWLATKKGFTPPADAVSFGFDRLKVRVASQEPALSRHLVRAAVGNATLALHVDLGDVHTQIRGNKWDKAGVQAVPKKAVLVDEAGTRREVGQSGVAGPLTIGAFSIPQVEVVAFGDKRWDELEVDGTVGLDAFAGHAVWQDSDTNKVYVAPEQPTDAKARIARWGSAILDACATPACTTASLLVPEAPEPAAAAPVDPAAPTAGAPAAPARPMPAPKPILHIERTAEVASLGFEVLIRPVGVSGVPDLIAIFPPGETQVTQALDDRFAGATFEVVDVDPFPRTCARAGACVYLLGGP